MSCSAVVLKPAMITSPAWWSLSGTAIKVFLILRTKWVMRPAQTKRGRRSHDYVPINNGQLTFTYREAKTRYGITAPRFDRALTELVRTGFVDVSEPGSGLYRMTTKFAISERWRLYDTPDFVEAERPKAAIRGCGFTKDNTYHLQRVRNFPDNENVHSRAESCAQKRSGAQKAMHADVHSPEIAICRK